jgi:hypothetical protein
MPSLREQRARAIVVRSSCDREDSRTSAKIGAGARNSSYWVGERNVVVIGSHRRKPPQIGSLLEPAAEEEGFEPSVDLTAHNGFRDMRTSPPRGRG